MKLILPDEMRAVEQAHFARESSFCVMDRAAKAVAERVMRSCPEGRVAVLCGPGNNGGDGYGAAAHLKSAGRDVVVYAAGEAVGDALREKQAYLSQSGRLYPLEEADLSQVTAVIDALLGIGLSREVRSEIKTAVEKINACSAYVISVDVPTGLDAETGKLHGVCVRADETVTFAFAKPGHWMYPGRKFVGRLTVAPLGLEDEAQDGAFEKLDPWEEARLLPERPPDSHKGTFGYVVTAAGSLGMTGAGGLASEAALRSGCGKTTWIYPGGCPVQPAREVMALPVGAYHFRPEDCETVRDYLSRAQALCLGPGLGRDPETFAFVHEIMRYCRTPFILDADGLMAYAGCCGEITAKVPGILTPHAGEAAALLGCGVGDVLADPIAAVRSMANQSGCVAVLKGASTLISDGQRVCINATGNEGMATAGAGDVLSGVIAGFLAQGLNAWDAAKLSVFVHGMAGDIAARDGKRGMLAGDILAALRPALRELEEE